GKPLICYTIEAARRATLLESFVVSTDNEAIASVARSTGAMVVMRPAELARDDSPTETALTHALSVMREKHGFAARMIVTLEPTSPLRTSALIDECVKTLLASDDDIDSVFTVREIRECVGTIDDGMFSFLTPGQPRRRQDRKPLYGESGTVYATWTRTLEKYGRVLGPRIKAVVVPDLQAIDINTSQDFLVAEAVMRQQANVPAGEIR
ncbi:MAG: acylneuraminate cytidylyltransferase family protein, partial [Elusimicrobiota bacterium]